MRQTQEKLGRITDLRCNVIILDCDGVIFDSNTFKSEAFGTVLSRAGYPKDLVNRFVQYHKENGGLSRYVKFRVFMTDYLKIPFDQSLYEKLLKEFSDYAIASYKKVSLTPSALEFLEAFKNRADFYIASGSDEQELVSVFEDKNLTHYFKAILGSPKSKQECVLAIIEKNPGKDIAFIGDSKTDLLVAKENKLDFIFMKKFSEDREAIMCLVRENGFRAIETLGDLLAQK